MDSISALAKVYESLSSGALAISPSDVTGHCAASVHEIIRQRRSGAITEDAIEEESHANN